MHISQIVRMSRVFTPNRQPGLVVRSQEGQIVDWAPAGAVTAAVFTKAERRVQPSTIHGDLWTMYPVDQSAKIQATLNFTVDLG